MLKFFRKIFNRSDLNSTTSDTDNASFIKQNKSNFDEFISKVRINEDHIEIRNMFEDRNSDLAALKIQLEELKKQAIDILGEQK